jgi:phosphoglycerol transferase
MFRKRFPFMLTPLALASSAALAVLLYRFPDWLVTTFGPLSLEQLMFHLGAETTGVPFRLVKSALREMLVKPLMAFALVYFLVRCFSARVPKWMLAGTYAVLAAYAYIGAAQLYHITALGEHIDRSSRLQLSEDFDWMDELYVAPKVRVGNALGKARPHNLVWVYVESLEERRVSSAKHPVLHRASQTPAQFTNLPGTTWTIGGMVSSQCGVPLLPYKMFARNSFSDSPTFLKNAPCLGDILHEHGYASAFIGGADTKFAGKGTFLATHGFQKILGKHELADRVQTPPPADWWGYSDDIVFDHAMEEIKRLDAADEPYSLSLLTLDTHGPRGYYSDHCKEQGFGDDIEAIFDCAVSQIEGFIETLEKQGLLDDTVLVVSGDHPFMEPRKTYMNPLDYEKERSHRKVFFSILHPNGKKIRVKAMNHFDMLPTVLSALGFEVEGQAAGLGRNLFATQSLSERYSPDDFQKILRVQSKGYEDLWE